MYNHCKSISNFKDNIILDCTMLIKIYIIELKLNLHIFLNWPHKKTPKTNLLNKWQLLLLHLYIIHVVQKHVHLHVWSCEFWCFSNVLVPKWMVALFYQFCQYKFLQTSFSKFLACNNSWWIRSVKQCLT